MSLGEKIREGTAWVASGNVGNQAVQFLFGIVLARLLVPADFGLLATIQVFTGVLAHFAGGGLGSALVRSRTLEERDWRVVFTLQCLVGAVIYALLFFAAPLVAAAFSEPRYEALLRVSALSFLIRPPSLIGFARLQREMRFKASALATSLAVCSAGIASVVLAATGMGVWSLVLGGLVGGGVSAVAAPVVAQWRPAFAFDFVLARRHSGIGFKFTANDLVEYLRQQTSVIIVSHVQGPAALGLFNRGANLAVTPVQLISGSAYPVMFRALAATRDDQNQSRYLYYRAIQLVAFYLLPLYVGLAFLAHPFMQVVYGERWLAAAEPLRVLALGGLFACINNQSGAVVAAFGRLGSELARQSVAWIATIAGLLVAAPHGIVACAWVVLAVRIAMALAMSRLAQGAISGSLRAMWRALRPALLMNSILVLVLVAAKELWLDRYAPASPAMYLAAMTAIGGLVYTGMFLMVPMRELASESLRWRRRLGLV